MAHQVGVAAGVGKRYVDGRGYRLYLYLVSDRARVLVENLRNSARHFLLCPRNTFVADGELDQDVKRMVGFWRAMVNEGGE